MDTIKRRGRGKTDRNDPRNARSSDATTTVFDFERRFPDDAACLEELVRMLYPDGIKCPNCKKVTKHHRLKNRPAYSCQFCGHLEYPMKGTIFEGSSTSLKLWFYGMYLMASTRCGISAKQLEREVGVSYPTALRMFRQIRSLLDQGDVLLGGTVEMDESYFGGKDKWKHERKRPHKGTGGVTKTTVVGMVERGASGTKGKVVAKVADGTGIRDLIPHAKQHVLPATTVYTDEWRAYRHLGGLGYDHSRINHSQGVYVSGDVHTNTIEGFWATVKRGIGGTYHSVSTKHLQSYLDEYAFRYNNRGTPDGMFNAFLGRIEKTAE
jgi:transposase-like protein